jgi:hypothetical protein
MSETGPTFSRIVAPLLWAAALGCGGGSDATEPDPPDVLEVRLTAPARIEAGSAGRFECLPPVTATATGGAPGVRAVWTGGESRVVTVSEAHRDIRTQNDAREFWGVNDIAAGESLTAAGWGFVFPDPMQITIKFYYRVGLGAMQSDSVTVICD